MKFTTLIPKRYNDGTQVSTNLLRNLRDALAVKFGGLSVEGDVTGYWTDSDGKSYVDTSIKISIECDRSRLQDAIRHVQGIGKRLKQKAMYFEVSGYDGVQFLRINRREK